ncbi:hypothetical protein [Cyanobium gracile]|uniref:Uncharacterized protein n=1 Tax=Cyanobium gracile UHCC 0281 TaxID=3110309 RepID=A0ABU5SXS8_9CYAN|nr:hypothetical protein [Cyanobium gracile]MEA5443269.1 hypothetical protein [Cyanobium gracile UHCC 0281]
MSLESTSTSISKSEFLASLPPWRRWLAKLNWHPTIDAQIREHESEKRTKLLEKEDKRLAVIESKLDALLLNAD